MEEKEGGSSLLAVEVVMAVLALYFFWGYRESDFEIPPQFTVLTEVFAEKCRSVSSDCLAVLKDGSIARVNYNRPLLGHQIIIHPKTKGGEIKTMGLGKFFREGGRIIFDPSISSR